MRRMLPWLVMHDAHASCRSLYCAPHDVSQSFVPPHNSSFFHCALYLNFLYSFSYLSPFCAGSRAFTNVACCLSNDIGRSLLALWHPLSQCGPLIYPRHDYLWAVYRCFSLALVLNYWFIYTVATSSAVWRFNVKIFLQGFKAWFKSVTCVGVWLRCEWIEEPRPCERQPDGVWRWEATDRSHAPQILSAELRAPTLANHWSLRVRWKNIMVNCKQSQSYFAEHGALSLFSFECEIVIVSSALSRAHYLIRFPQWICGPTADRSDTMLPSTSVPLSWIG